MKPYFVSIVLLLSLCHSSLFAQDVTKAVAQGLGSEVTVRRDARHIPYIEAANDADLYFAQGYVTASDRLWQMDLMRRLARGETAEIFGKASLEEDKRWRRYNFSKIADDNLQYLSPRLRAALSSYAAGVNAFIATLNGETIPVEFRLLQYKPGEWRPSDTIVIGKILSDALSTTWRNDLLRASLKDLPAERLADLINQVTPYDVVLFGNDTAKKQAAASGGLSVPVSASLLAIADEQEKIRRSSLERVGLYAEELAASNNWVISGKRTADGRPILANDPHLLPTAPGIWYLTHLSSPSMRVSGVTFPGVPGIVLGHNENTAWGATNVGPDVQDLYRETFNDAGKYKTPAGWQDAVVRKETIKVRINPLKTDTEPVVLEVLETRNGPIIAEEGGVKYSLKWTASDPKNNEFEAFVALNHAGDWSDFKDALRTYGGATQNFVYADIKGNIGWYAAGRIPVRRSGDGSLPYDGATADGDWTGYIPFNELPNLYNPSSGLIVTANQRITGTSYKYPQMSRDAAPPWRARRIVDALTSKVKITMDDVRDVQYDTVNIPLSNLAKAIVAANTASPETIRALRDWDGRMTADSQPALLANEIMGCVASRMATLAPGVPSSVVRERVVDMAVRERLARWLPTGTKDYPDLFKGCDADRRADLTKRFGSDPSAWTWGRTWQSRFPHPLAVVPLIGAQFAIPTVPLNGSGQTPNVGSYVSMRHIASPGAWDTTRHGIPLGQSGDPRSPHFKDQFEAWRTGETQVFPFTQTAVSAATVKTMKLVPR